MTKINARTLKKFDRYVSEMRDAGCVVIAYTPEDVRSAILYQLATSMTDPAFEWHPDVDLVQVAQDVHEDDTLWDSLSEACAYAYKSECEAMDDFARQQEREEVI